MAKILNLTMFLLLFFVVSASAQRPALEYGDESDLKGVTKVFVNTGRALNLRKSIIKNIRKELTNLEFVSREDEAEVVLVFDEGIREYSNGLATTTTSNTQVNEDGSSNTIETTTTSPQITAFFQGEGMVLRKVTPYRERLLIEFNDRKSYWFERDPSTNFAKAFIKAYKNANK